MDESPRPPTARDLTNTELRALCRRRGINPKGGLSRAGRADLLTWVELNGLLGRDAQQSTGEGSR